MPSPPAAPLRVEHPENVMVRHDEETGRIGEGTVFRTSADRCARGARRSAVRTRDRTNGAPPHASRDRREEPVLVDQRRPPFRRVHASSTPCRCGRVVWEGFVPQAKGRLAKEHERGLGRRRASGVAGRVVPYQINGEVRGERWTTRVAMPAPDDWRIPPEFQPDPGRLNYDLGRRWRPSCRPRPRAGGCLYGRDARDGAGRAGAW